VAPARTLTEDHAMRITHVESLMVDIPFVVPFVVWRGTSPSKRHVFVRIETNTGLTGWGEAPPFLYYAPETALDVHTFVRDVLTNELLDQDPRDLRRLMHGFDAFDGHHFARAAVETALWDLLAQTANLPLYRLLGGAVRAAVPVTAVVHTEAPATMAAAAAELVGRGFTSLKLKIGFGLDEDEAMVAAVREAVGPRPLIRVDAEEHYTVKEALALGRRLDRFGIELISQPVPRDDWNGMRTLRQQLPMPVLADEGIHSAADVMRAVRAQAADMVNIKVLKSGGLLAAAEMAAIGRANHLPVLIGSMIETGIGSLAAAHLAITLPGVFSTELCGPLLFTADALATPLTIRDGAIWLDPDTPGLGHTPDLDFLARNRVIDAGDPTP
jgi:L-alanine-DL-glutamate epimerase-like enolase superfamily enzyme